MNRFKIVTAAVALLALPMTATVGSAATLTNGFTVGVTEGSGQNRATVVGTTDLNFDSKNPADDLGTLGQGDIFGIYGRIVNASDSFTFAFQTTGAFKIEFDLDGYYAYDDGEIGDASFIEQSGLIDQDLLTNAANPGGKRVEFSLSRDGTDLGTQARATNITSANPDGSVLFRDSAAGQYMLTITGINRTPALYDINISQVPVPSAGLLLLTALGGAAAMRRRKKAAAA